jgi:hypothetical protein
MRQVSQQNQLGFDQPFSKEGTDKRAEFGCALTVLRGSGNPVAVASNDLRHVEDSIA